MKIKRILLRLINFWPPFIGARIRVRRISPDFRAIDVEMKLRPWNQNYVGVHFGGSLYAMSDPFYMLMLMENLGRDYIVWDKAAEIRFRKPGKGRVHCAFRLTEQEVEAVRHALQTNRKVEPVFTVLIKDEADEVVAEVTKTLYVRRKESP